MRNQQLLIQKGFKAGKFSKEQAGNLWAEVKAIRAQESSFFRQNGNHGLTEIQETQISNALDKNSQILGESKEPSSIK